MREGQASSCTIVKNDTGHPVYPQSLRRISVVAAETQDRYLPGVSPRLQLSRTSLLALRERLPQPAPAPLQFEGLAVFGVADEEYYVDRGVADFAPVGDLAPAFIRQRGK